MPHKVQEVKEYLDIREMYGAVAYRRERPIQYVDFHAEMDTVFNIRLSTLPIRHWRTFTVWSISACLIIPSF